MSVRTGGSRIPIYEKRNSRMHHLAVKAAEWNGAAVREGLYIPTLVYIQSGGNWSCGCKLDIPETIRKECGDAIGGKDRLKAEVEWYSVDVGEWYRGVKLEIFN